MNTLQTTNRPATIAHPSNTMPVELSRELSVWLADRAPKQDGESRLPAMPPSWHPDAARWAAIYRERLSRPTTLKQVGDWVLELWSLPRANSTVSIEACTKMILIACQHLPGAVWSRKTVALALQEFEWFPAPAKVFKLLSAEADRLERMVVGLEAIAKAPQAVHAVAAPTPYQPPPAPAWAFDRGIGRRYDGEPASRPDLTFHAPVRTVEQQLAALAAG